MKKSYSKDELAAMAAPVIKQHGMDKVYATADGQVFLMENRARLHAGKGVVYELHADEADVTAGTGADEPLSVKEIEKIASETDDAEALGLMLGEEKAGKNRKTALKVIGDRIEELKTAGA